MNGAMLQDRIFRGMGMAAWRIGTPHEVFRPTGPRYPLARDNRRLQLQATFSAQDARFSKPAAFGQAAWWGVFDAAYTAPGDYLVGAHGTFFVAAQQPLLPVLCVRANRTVSAGRPVATANGVRGYGGVQLAQAEPLLLGWPASVLGVSGEGGHLLPGDAGQGSATVLLPRLPAVLRPGDLLLDDLGRTMAVTAAEETELGWRLAARQATS